MNNKNKKQLVKIGEAARMLGTIPATLRLWERTGEVLPTRKTASGTRYYNVESLRLLAKSIEPDRCTLCFAISDEDRDMFDRYCEANDCEYEIVISRKEALSSKKKLVVIPKEVFLDCN